MEHFLGINPGGAIAPSLSRRDGLFPLALAGERILELTPHARCERGLVLSCAIRWQRNGAGGDSRPAGVQRLVREALPLRAGGCW
ncbi:hypothetical protein LNO89_04440 [Klebsiella pneumoniae subsp. pneumoniae]|nr:hypothetical protein [Klebsiella pneumoniae subsp. pneumoniae]